LLFCAETPLRFTFALVINIRAMAEDFSLEGTREDVRRAVQRHLHPSWAKGAVIKTVVSMVNLTDENPLGHFWLRTYHHGV
jgi:hypothetical protein